MSLLMLDSIEVSVFAGLRFDVLAGYVGGHWPDYADEVRDYPQLYADHRIWSIAVNASEDAEFLDCERGDASPSQCGPWLRRQLERGVWRPGIYGSESDWPAIDASVRAAGISRADHRRWVAKWVFTPQLLAGYDAQQWADRYLGRNIDPSQVLESAIAPTHQPPHKNTPNYDIYPSTDPKQPGMHGGPFLSPWGELDERDVVQHYDGAREQPEKYKTYLPKLEAELHWLARRVANIAIYLHPKPDGHANWKPDNRGSRYQNLIHRAQGRRFV